MPTKSKKKPETKPRLTIPVSDENENWLNTVRAERAKTTEMCLCCENEIAVRNDVCGPCGDELEILEVQELAAEFDRKFGPNGSGK